MNECKRVNQNKVPSFRIEFCQQKCLVGGHCAAAAAAAAAFACMYYGEDDLINRITMFWCDSIKTI